MLKAFLLLASLGFLISGGACSLGLLLTGTGAIAGIPLGGLCIFAFVSVIRWMNSTSNVTDTENADPKIEPKKPPVVLVVVTGVIVIAAYFIVFASLSGVGMH